MVLCVDLQVLREVVDPLGEQRHLHLRRAGVGLVEAVLGDRGRGVGHAAASVFVLMWERVSTLPTQNQGTTAPQTAKMRRGSSPARGGVLASDPVGRRPPLS